MLFISFKFLFVVKIFMNVLNVLQVFFVTCKLAVYINCIPDLYTGD